MPKANIAAVLDALEQPKQPKRKLAPAKKAGAAAKHGTMKTKKHGFSEEELKRSFIGAECERWRKNWWVGEARKRGMNINRIVIDALTRELGEPIRE